MNNWLYFEYFIDNESKTYTYIISDTASKETCIIDPVLENVDKYVNQIKHIWWNLKYILDTHVHADHITGSSALKKRLWWIIGLWEKNQVLWADIFLKDNEKLRLWETDILTLSTPGHTKGCVSYIIDDMIFTWNLLFINGTGRTDFQWGSNEEMYSNITQRIFQFPGDYKIFPWHDYNGNLSSTVQNEKCNNQRIWNNKSIEEFSQIMDSLNLPYPKKIDIALPRNLKCGRE